MNNEKVIDLFSHPKFSDTIFSYLHSIVKIYNPSEKSDFAKHKKFSSIDTHLYFLLSAYKELPTAWLTSQISIFLIGRGDAVHMKISRILNKDTSKKKFVYYVLMSQLSQPLLLKNYEDIHCISSTGKSWSAALSSILKAENKKTLCLVADNNEKHGA